MYTREYVEEYLYLMNRYVAVKGSYWFKYSHLLDEWIESSREPLLDDDLEDWTLFYFGETWNFKEVDKKYDKDYLNATDYINKETNRLRGVSEDV